MNRLNPNAVIFWTICSGIGYLIGGTNGAVIGGITAMTISLIL